MLCKYIKNEQQKWEISEFTISVTVFFTLIVVSIYILQILLSNILPSPIEMKQLFPESLWSSLMPEPVERYIFSILCLLSPLLAALSVYIFSFNNLGNSA